MHRAPTPVIPMKMGIYSILFCLLVPAGVCNTLYLSFLFSLIFSIFLAQYAILDTQYEKNLTGKNKYVIYRLTVSLIKNGVSDYGKNREKLP